jgi:Tfp pilus assembly protein PilN
MRPVNLIPPEQRRGDRAPLRSGPLSYVIVGALAFAVLGVSAVVLTQNKIKDREAEVAALEVRQAEATTRAESLRAFADFASLSEARTATVTSLAQSRFDWDRVLRELALVLPDDVWLVSLSGTVSPETAVDDQSQVSLRSDISGPALSLIGCGVSHESVASFLQALKDIDGVTRVGITKSELSATGPGGEASGGDGSDADCRTRDFIARFEIVAAFDEVSVPAVADPAAAAAPTAEVPAATSGDGSGVAEAQASEQQARDSSAKKTDQAREATSEFIPGVTR